MYYYIFQKPKGFGEDKLHENIKKQLINLGISGETTLVSPVRSASELAIMGVEKGYSTIVAVGGDELINEVASNIQGTGAVLGIVPINAGEDICEIIGTSNPKQACMYLQKRYLKTIDMGYIEPGISFLSKLIIQSNKTLSVQAEINNFYIETRADQIVIDNRLVVKMYLKKEKNSLWNNLVGMFNNNPEYDVSKFNATKLKLRTHEILNVKIGDLIIAKTPIIAFKNPEALKIITNYSKIR